MQIAENALCSERHMFYCGAKSIPAIITPGIAGFAKSISMQPQVASFAEAPRGTEDPFKGIYKIWQAHTV
jgi:hypothetical protein